MAEHDIAIGQGVFDRDAAVKRERLLNVELRAEIIRLRSDLEELAKACHGDGFRGAENGVRYILGQSIERGAL